MSDLRFHVTRPFRLLVFLLVAKTCWALLTLSPQLAPPAATGSAAAQSPTYATHRRAVAPVGWRRTTRGWERLDRAGGLPHSGRSIESWIRQQEAEEAGGWMAWLRPLGQIHPLGIATWLLVVSACLMRAPSHGRCRGLQRVAHFDFPQAN